MEEQGKALIIILQTLARRGAETARRSLGLVAGEHLVGDPKSGALRRVVEQYPRLGERDLADLMRGPLSHDFSEGHFIELESSRYTNEGYSFLWCSWNLEGEPRAGFFYGMFRLGRRHAVEGEALPHGHVPQFWGYRF